MSSADKQIQRAVEHHLAGRLQDAERLYRAILKMQPGHSDANHNLGILAVQANQPGAGLPYLKAALESSPKHGQYWISYIDALIRAGQMDNARQALLRGRRQGLSGPVADELAGLLDSPAQQEIDALILAFSQGRFAEAELSANRMTRDFPYFPLGWKVLGATLQVVGRTEEALPAMQKAAQLSPGDAKAQLNLGITLYGLGRLAEAEAGFRRALAIEPGYAEAYNNLGAVLRDLGRLDEAEASCRQALVLKPGYAEAHLNLSSTLYNLGRLNEAEASCRQALAVKPSLAEAHLNLGAILYDFGRLVDAEASCRQALAIKPHLPKGYSNLGNVFRVLGRLDEAEASVRQAILLKPDYAEAYSNLGTVLKDSGWLSDAEASHRQAILLKPDYAEAHSNLGAVLQDLGQLIEAEACYRRALAIQPDYFESFSNLLVAFNYQSTADRGRAYSEAVEYGKAVRKKAASSFTRWTCPQGSRLRIGLVSGDLGNHPVGYFLESLLSKIDPDKIELVAYATSPKADSLTDRIRNFFHGWHALCGLSNEAAARLIHSHGTHILVDLSGHTAHNRLPLFAWKPAPVQVAWLGYFATTGLFEIDYFLGDPHVTPPGAESHFTEKLWRLPDSRFCFTPPCDAPGTTPLPALAKGHVTFGCFQNMTKVGDETLDLWREVLEQLPASRLRWQCSQFKERSVAENALSRLNAHGISSGRIDLLGPVGRPAYLEAHAEVDVILDTFPFTGGTTTCEALWMGVPTLTLAGSTLISRQGMGLMSAAGLPEWVARSREEYAAKAVEFAGGREALSKLAEARSGLRSRIASSALFDAELFARNFEKAMQGMWKTFADNAHEHT